MKKYAMFDHTADIGIEIFGRTKKELFAHAAWALTDILLDRRDGKKVHGQQKTITVEGSDTADLLINFLRELLYLFNGDACVVYTCDIRACSTRKLEAVLQVVPFNRKDHALKMEIKAVTYSGVSVVKEKDGWKARVIFDV